LINDRSHGPRGNAAPDVPRPMTQNVMGCMPTQSVGMITFFQASLPATGTTALGFLNTSTLPTITNTSPTSAGAVHW